MKPTNEQTMRRALLKIMARDYDNMSGDPSKWSFTIAYKALGGEIKNGVTLDDEKLIKEYKNENR